MSLPEKGRIGHALEGIERHQQHRGTIFNRGDKHMPAYAGLTRQAISDL